LTNTSASAPATTTVAAAKRKENPYTKFDNGKCYRCVEPRHRSNDFPKRKQVNVADYGDERGVVIEEASNSDFFEEQGDNIACVG